MNSFLQVHIWLIWLLILRFSNVNVSFLHPSILQCRHQPILELRLITWILFYFGITQLCRGALCLPYRWWPIGECHSFIFYILFLPRSFHVSWIVSFHHCSFPCGSTSWTAYRLPEVIRMQISSFQNTSCHLVLLPVRIDVEEYH